MNMKELATPRVHLCSPARWLESLLNPDCTLELLVCRYFNRKGVFGLGPRVLNEHMITLVEHGVLLANVRGGDVRVPAGSALWMPPGEIQHFRGAGGGSGVRQYN